MQIFALYKRVYQALHTLIVGLFALIISTGCRGVGLTVDMQNSSSDVREDIAHYEVSLAGVNLLKKFEGRRLEPYVCSGGSLTVGYGQVIASQLEFYAQYPDGFSEVDAQNLLYKKLVEVYAPDIKRLVKVPLLQREFDMLTSLDYNIGATALNNPTSKPQNNWQTINLMPLLNASHYEEAASEFPKFTKGGPERPYYRGLLKRRMTEMFVFSNSTAIPEALRLPLADDNFRKLTKCDSIAKYWEDSGQQQLRDEAISLYHEYNARLESCRTDP